MRRNFATASIARMTNTISPTGLLLLAAFGCSALREAVNASFFKPLLEHGYTLFAVVHGSQPHFII